MADDSHVEIRRADPRARRKAVRLVACTVTLGVLAVLLARWYLDDVTSHANDDPRAAISRLLFVLKPLLVAFGVPFLLFAGWLGRLSYRVAKEQCFPPDGVAAIRDTRVLRGDKAKRLALVGFTVTTVMAACSVALPLLVWGIATTLTQR